ncbi:hypothetical protein EVAR_59874_1 [Eumeta japonica]|uniref:Uncharacterized protein n=1 Tax=Eumeta variegata TaxID=151549 RepID=A0A4C1XMP3_EUMVA|nr:hypothetical protein EVAR_59874_1 [Eumeta japonica]
MEVGTIADWMSRTDTRKSGTDNVVEKYGTARDRRKDFIKDCERSPERFIRDDRDAVRAGSAGASRALPPAPTCSSGRPELFMNSGTLLRQG